MNTLLNRLGGLVGLLLALPLLIPAALAVWISDGGNPFYVSERIGRGGRAFRFLKLRTMIVGADRNKVDTTTANDPRITRLGHFLRGTKLDELPQFINVVAGQVNLVGPRPNVRRETDLYTAEERRLLSVAPGITDLSSIIFYDLGDRLKGSADPNLDYNRLIRPAKSRLGLLYVDNRSLLLDLRLLWLTVVAIFDHQRAARAAAAIVARVSDDPYLHRVVVAAEPLFPFPPPGADAVVSSRSVATEAQASAHPS